MDIESDRQLARTLQSTFDMEMQMENPGNNLVYGKYKTKRHRQDLNSSKSLTDPSWELVDPTPDIYVLFKAFDQRFFWNKLGDVTVHWDKKMMVCAGVCSYVSYGFGGRCTIALSEPLLKLRPRKDLVETLLHEMIHALLFVTNNNKDRDGHGPEFHKHMHRINNEAGTNITVYHDFHDEVKFYQQQHVWRCDGACRNKRPYYGFVKRATNQAPGPSDRWWAKHQNKCGGTFIKIKEPTKSNPQLDEMENITGDMGNIFKVPNNDIIKTLKDSTSNTSNNDIVNTIKNVISNSPNNPIIDMLKNVIGNTPNNGIMDIMKNVIGNTPTSNNDIINTLKGFLSNTPNNDIGNILKGFTGNTSKPNKENIRTGLGNIFTLNDIKNGNYNSPVNTNSFNSPNNHFNIKSPGNMDHSLVRNQRLKIFDNATNSIQAHMTQNNNNIMNTIDRSDEIYTKKPEDFKAFNEEKLINCPICNCKIEENLVNRHLDTCLSETEIKQSNPPNKEMVTYNDKKDMFKCEICHENMDEETYNRHLTECLNKMCDNNDYIYDFKEPEAEKTVACLVCGEPILKQDLNLHLEKCMEDVFDSDVKQGDENYPIYDDDNDDVNYGDKNTLYNCPICTNLIAEDEMNVHIDQCLDY